MKLTPMFGSVLTCFLCCIQSGGAQVKDTGLVLHYDFSEGLGNTLHDKSGNGYHGEIGPLVGGWIEAGTGYALEFEGKSDEHQRNAPAVICPSDAGLEMKLSDWTIAVLVKISQSVAGSTSGPTSAAGMYWVHKSGWSDAFPGYVFGYWGHGGQK